MKFRLTVSGFTSTGLRVYDTEVEIKSYTYFIRLRMGIRLLLWLPHGRLVGFRVKRSLC